MSQASLTPPPSSILTVEEAQHFYTLQHLSIGFLALLWYDYLLTLAQEIWLVWGATNSTTKYAMLIYRYGTLLSLTLIAYTFSGYGQGLTIGPFPSCQRLFPVIAVFGVVFNTFADFIALLHIAALWRHDRRAILILILVFTATSIAAVACLCVTIAQATSGILYHELLNVCIFLRRPSIIVVSWAAGAVFDSTAFIFLAIKTPLNFRSMWCHAGTVYFLVSFSIRIFNLLDSVALPRYLFSLIATISWPCFAINLSRFVFRLRGRQRLRELENLSLQTLSGDGQHPILSYQTLPSKHSDSTKMDASMPPHDLHGHHGDYDSIIEMNTTMTSPPAG